ncbi:MAG: amidohydrolase [Planctomycetota bacterium]
MTRHSLLRGSALFLLGISVACRSTSPVRAAPVREHADLVLQNGKIVTVDAKHGTVEALAVRGDRILAVGSNEEIQGYVDASTERIDLEGKLAIPGFIEGHGHFTGLGKALQILDLTKVRSWDEVIEIVAAAVKKASPGEWILGRGWHQEKWDRPPEGHVGGFPTHHSLSAVSPDNPVRLTHASGHAAFFNAKAMELAGISARTQDPPGGDILRDENGEPTGVFRERAQGLVGRVRGAGELRRSREEKEAELRRAIRLADQECISHGVTSFQDAGSSFAEIDVFERMVGEGKIRTRLWIMVRASNAQLARKLPAYRKIGTGAHHLTVRAIKQMIDGALGSRGAWLLEPYDDEPGSRGHNTASVEELTETARLAALHGYQLCVHAIGDRANREVLDIFEKTFRENPELRDSRWRIEHAQHIAAQDIPRFGQLGVIASMQASHCTSDGPWVIPRLGRARAAEGAYVWQKLIRSGALVTNGSDVPVEEVDPINSYYAAVSRKLADGTRFFPEQRMSRMQALRSYTIDCAKAAFEEGIKGSLSPGKLADIVVLSRDILTVPEDEIPDTEVRMTIVGGKLLYRRE